MTTLSADKVVSELKGVEDAVAELGYKIDPYMRPPEGAYSIRTLKIQQDMGYKTIFWSFAAVDWDVNNQPGVQTVYNSFMEKYCNGCIPLLHIISESSTGAVKPIVESMTEKGYRFGTLDELGKIKGSITVSIKKRLTYNKKAVSPVVTTENTGSKLTFNYYKKVNGKYQAIDAAPELPGLYYVQVKAEATEKYAQAESEKVHFHIARADGKLTLEIEDKEYDGKKPVAYVHKKGDYPNVYVRYFDESGNRLKSAPTEPGTYYAEAYAKKTTCYNKCISERVKFIIYGNYGD